MIYKITQIEFDLSTDDDSIPEEEMTLVQQELQEEYIGKNWEANDEDDLVDVITCVSGWCIKSIDYVEILG